MNKEITGLEFVGATTLIIVACVLFVGLIMLIEDYCRMRRDVKLFKEKHCALHLEGSRLNTRLGYLEPKVDRLLTVTEQLGAQIVALDAAMARIAYKQTKQEKKTK